MAISRHEFHQHDPVATATLLFEADRLTVPASTSSSVSVAFAGPTGGGFVRSNIPFVAPSSLPSKTPVVTPNYARLLEAA